MSKKLQQEIDKTLKKVQEGLDEITILWSKFDNAESPAQKDKLENELKKEIKRLQRFRDDIRRWQQSNEVKNSKPLLATSRRNIEEHMEKFKTLERESKLKAFSKHGLLRQSQNMESSKPENEPFLQWLHEQVVEFQNKIDSFESKIEELQDELDEQGGTNSANSAHLKQQIDDNTRWIELFQFHFNNCQKAYELLFQDIIVWEQVEELKEGVLFFFDSFADDDYIDDECLYEVLDETPAQVEERRIKRLESMTTTQQNAYLQQQQTNQQLLFQQQLQQQQLAAVNVLSPTADTDDNVTLSLSNGQLQHIQQHNQQNTLSPHSTLAIKASHTEPISPPPEEYNSYQQQKTVWGPNGSYVSTQSTPIQTTVQATSIPNTSQLQPMNNINQTQSMTQLQGNNQSTSNVPKTIVSATSASVVPITPYPDTTISTTSSPQNLTPTHQQSQLQGQQSQPQLVTTNQSIPTGIDPTEIASSSTQHWLSNIHPSISLLPSFSSSHPSTTYPLNIAANQQSQPYQSWLSQPQSFRLGPPSWSPIAHLTDPTISTSTITPPNPTPQQHVYSCTRLNKINIQQQFGSNNNNQQQQQGSNNNNNQQPIDNSIFTKLSDETLRYICTHQMGTPHHYFAAKQLKLRGWRYHIGLGSWVYRVHTPEFAMDKCETSLYIVEDRNNGQLYCGQFAFNSTHLENEFPMGR